MLINIIQSFKDNRKESGIPKHTLLSLLKDVYRGNKQWYFILFSIILITSCFSLGLQYFVKELIDIFSNTPPSLNVLWDNMWICIGIILMCLLEPIFWSLSGIIGANLFPQARGRIRKELFYYVSGHDRNYFENTYTGSLTTKIKTAGDAFDEILCLIAWSFLPILTRLIVICVGFLLISYWLTLIVLVGFVVYLTLLRHFSKDITDLEKRFSVARSQTMGRLADSLNNHRSISSYANRWFETKLANTTINFEEYRHSRAWTKKDFVQLLQDCLTAIIALGLLSGSFYLWSSGTITIGTCVLITTLVMTLITESRSVADATLTFSKHIGSLSDSLETIYKPYRTEYNGTVNSVNSHKIEFENVHFSYDNENQVLNNFNLVIPQGQSIGIVGSSGSGKSTLISLIHRAYECEGILSIGGVDIKDLDINFLRKSISIVPQRPEIFSRTIMENIRYGNLAATDDQVIEAAKLAHAHEFIELLPDRYSSVAGEHGVKLSGGQAQRIAIARSFLKNSPILILDEATSALDSESEYYIHQSLTELIKGKTTIAIAHRLSTLKTMDRLIVLKDGIIVEDGNHNDLLNKNGEYKKLWEYQSLI